MVNFHTFLLMSCGTTFKNHAFLLFLMFSSLGCSIYSGFIFKHNSLREELTKSRECMSIYIYLATTTLITFCLGVFLLGFLFYKWLCKTVCDIKTQLGFNLTRLVGLLLYLGLNVWGYYIIFFHLSQECRNYLNDNKNIQGVYLSFLASFGITLLWSVIRIFTSGCSKKGSESHRLVIGNSAAKDALRDEYHPPESLPMRGTNIRYGV